jgi:hypothetical protein
MKLEYSQGFAFGLSAINNHKKNDAKFGGFAQIHTPGPAKKFLYNTFLGSDLLFQVVQLSFQISHFCQFVFLLIGF